MLRTNVIRRSLAAALCMTMILSAGVACFADDGSAEGRTVEGVQSSFRPDDEDLYLSVLEAEYVDNTVTTVVQRGTFSVNAAFRGQIAYENAQLVSADVSNGTVRFEQFLTVSGRQIKKGEPIAEISVSTESVDLNALKEQIERKTKDLEEYIATNTALLEEYAFEKLIGKTENDRIMASLLYDRLEVNFTNERAEREAEIEQLSNNYAAYSFVEPIQYVTSPCDGVVGYLNRFHKGDTLGGYSFLAIIYGKGKVAVQVPASENGLRYGQHVTVHQMQGGGEEVVAEGVVTTCRSSLLSPNLIGSYDIIELTGDASELDPNNEVTVRAKSVEMENALIVPTKAVYSDTKGSYVFLYRDDHSVKHYVVTGGSNSQDTWIVRGVEEGDVLVVK